MGIGKSKISEVRKSEKKKDDFRPVFTYHVLFSLSNTLKITVPHFATPRLRDL